MSSTKFIARNGLAVGTSAVDVVDSSGELLINAPTASKLLTARTISLSGDVVGSVSFDGSGNATIATTIQADSVALGTDTTGNYMLNVSAGTGVSVSHTQSEGSTATVSIGQAVGTTDNVTFNSVTVNGTLTSDDITSTNISVAGNATITGNLTVSGTTTTINSTTIAIADLNLELARNATTAAAANGAGITVTGPVTPATLTYTSADDRWNLNKNLNVTTVFGAFNGTVGATTANTGAFTAVSATSAQLTSYAEIRNDAAALYLENTTNTRYWLQQLDGGSTIPNFDIRYYDGSTTSTIGRYTSTGLAVTGTLSSTLGATIQGLTVGLGAGAVSTNTAVGYQAQNATATLGSTTAVGYQAAYSNTGAEGLTYIGRWAGYSTTTGSNNTSVGVNSLFYNTTGANNVANGHSALFYNTASNNTAVGYQAGYSNTTGAQNTFIGLTSGYSNTTGSYNTAIGWESLKANTTGRNTAYGIRSLLSNTTGTSNTAIGDNAMGLNTTGDNNVALGYSALEKNTTASNNTAVGYQAGYSNTTGTGNLYLGRLAGYSATSSTNTFVGEQSGYNNTTGARNTYIGNSAGFNATTGSNNTFIGLSGTSASGAAMTTGSNNTILGGYSGNQGGLDIRTASNYIVLSDGDGNPRAYWNGANATFNGGITVKDSMSASTTNAGGNFNLFSNLTGFQSLTIAGGNLITGTDKYVYVGTGTNHATSTTTVEIGSSTSGSLTKVWSPLTVVGAITGSNLSGTNTGDQTNISGNAATATNASAAVYVSAQDIRTLSPSSTAASRMAFGFTSWANNNSGPYADYLALRSYQDASGGNDNLVMFNKSSIAMRVWQQSWGSSSAYSSYADVLMSNNYNSYSPTLTGTGASGTWGISVTGNAATASSVSATGATNLYSPNAASVVAADSAMPAQGNSLIHTLAFGPSGNDGHIIGMTWANTTTIYGAQIWLDTDPTNAMAIRGRSNVGTWTAWAPVLTSVNYNSYSPTLTGGGASGTWGINITGSAATATDSTKLPLAGGTMTGVINMSGTQTITTAGFAGIEYYNNATWQVFIGTENNTSGARFNSRTGIHTWYNNSTQTMQLSGNNLTGVGSLRFGNGNSTPAGISFSHTLAGISSNRIVNFDGNANGTPSVWWTSGSRAYGAIDAKDPGLTFWANDGSSWQQQFEINYGNVTVNTNIRSPIFYDSNDTAYFLNPASSGGIALETIGEIRFKNNAGTFTHFNYSNGGTSNYIRGTTYFDGSTVQFSSGNLRWSGAGYDLEDTFYFVDPNSVSVLNDLRVASGNTQIVTHNVVQNTKWRSLSASTDVGISFYNSANTWCMQLYANAGTEYGFLNGNWASWDMRKVPSGNLYMNNNNSYYLNAPSDNYMYRVYGAADIRSPIFYDLDNTAYYGDFASTSRMNDVRATKITRADHNQGFLEGSYNNVGSNGAKTNPIYTIGSSYNPSATALSNMYGIGYSHPDFWGSGKGGGWGLYVAAAGIIKGVFGAESDPNTWISGYGLSDSSWRAPIFYDSDNTSYYVNPNSFSRLNRLVVDQARVDSSRYPLGHYSSGETIFEIDPTWTNDQLQAFFNSGNVSWVADSSAPGGYAISITGNQSVAGGVYGAGFPFIPVEQDDMFYMECWIKDVSGTNGHYMGSIDYNENFSSLGGNPGSFGYWVMSNSYPGTSWQKYSGYIGGFGNSVGQFKSGTKYWSPQALFNYIGSGTSYISGWKVTKVNKRGKKIIQATGLSGGTSTSYQLQIQNSIGASTSPDITIGADGSYGYIQTWSGKPLLLNEQGNTVYAYDFRPTIVYDRNDTAYYLDPNSNSKFVNLGLGGVTPDVRLSVSGDAHLSNILYLGGNAGSVGSWGSRDYTTSGLRYFNASTYEFNNNGYGSTYTFAINASLAQHSSSVRAPIFYDSNDTAYYVDPNSTSDAALRMRGGALFGPNTTWGSYLLVGGDGRQNYTNSGSTASVCSTNGNLHIDAASGYDIHLNLYDGNNVYFGNGSNSIVAQIASDGTFRSPIFYDYNNTGYYLDPTSTTSLRTVGDWRSDSSTWTGEFAGKIQYHSNNWYFQYTTEFNFRNAGGSNVFYGDNSGNTFSIASSRAPIFYDSNDTSYYVNPNSTSNIHSLFVRPGGVYAAVTDLGWVSPIQVGETGTGTGSERYIPMISGTSTSPSGYRQHTVFGSLRGTVWGSAFIAVGGNDLYPTVAYTFHYDGSGTAPGSWRAPIFYDSNDTGYYVNPNGTSNLYDLQITGASHKYLYINPGNGYEAMVRYNGGTGSGWYVGKRTANQTVATGDFHFYSEAAGATVGGIDTGGNMLASGSHRAPIFYDVNDTTYYVDPNGYSQLSSGEFNNYLRVAQLRFTGEGGDSGLGSQPTSYGIYQQGGAWTHPYPDLCIGFHTGIKIGAYYGYNGTRFYNNSDWATQIFSVGDGDNNVRSYYDIRAPIFYDLDNTGYYVNPNGTSNLSTVYVNSYLDLTTSRAGSSHGYASSFVTTQSANGNFTPFTFTSTQGDHSWGQIARFRIDSGVSDRPSIQFSWGGNDTRWNVGYNTGSDDSFRITQNMGYRNDNATSDGWGTPRLVVDTSGNFFSNVSTRSPIFYDLDNTAYYIDAASTSSLNRISTVRTDYWLYIDSNYGHSVVGLYNSTIFQGVFAMGDSYKLTPGGGINNLYGMTWSYPSAGGIAGNLDSHGMIVAINGGFGSCMSYSIKASGNVTAYSDERLKTNWRDMPESYVSKLAKVKVGIYDRMDGEKLTQVGVSAQSLQTILPEAVITADDDIKTLSVNYGGAALASAIELAKDNMELRGRIEKLEALVYSLLNKE